MTRLFIITNGQLITCDEDDGRDNQQMLLTQGVYSWIVHIKDNE